MEWMDNRKRKWMVVGATIWIQAFTGTNFDFSAYSSALKSSLSISQHSLNYLATASDLGKALGWSSGLALLYLPLPAVLLLSAVCGLVSYAIQWLLLLTSPPTVSLPYPVVFLACLVAGCSICWFNTICFVLCVRNFSANNRSLALSLSVSFNGVSAALYTLFANAMSPLSSSVYLLLNAILPLAVSVIALPAILLCEPSSDGLLNNMPEHETRIFVSLYVLAFVTGIYFVIFSSVTTSCIAWAILVGAILLLALHIVIPMYSSCCLTDTHAPDSTFQSQLNLEDPNKPLLVLGDDQQRKSTRTIHQLHNQAYQRHNSCSCGTMGKSRVIVLGEEHTAKKLVRSVDFWLYYLAYFCGATVGLVYSNNLGQIAQSMHRQAQLTLLAVYSSCSFFGRLLSAIPDFLHGKLSFARTGWLAAALVPMPVAFFILCKSHDEHTLVAGTALIGLSSGFIFAAAVSVTSELFGPNSIGVNHNILITNIPIGSLLYGQIAALVYDANGWKSRVLDNQTGIVDTMVMCMGAKCYATTFFLWGCITLVGLASSIALFLRTRLAYSGSGDHSKCKRCSQVLS